MTLSLDTLRAALEQTLGERIVTLITDRGELTLTVKAADYAAVALTLRDEPSLHFEQLIDLAGLDYSAWRDGEHSGPRYCIAVHLMSVRHNWRLRIKVFAPDDDMPLLTSVTPIWSAANWFEREAFDLYGIVFDGHDDLRRILTDYGFIGHPFRKDFPTTGHVEMTYDAVTKRVVYQPITIELREITPRVIREDNYGNLH